MPDVRPLNRKYGISKHAFLTAYNYCHQYKEWKRLMVKYEKAGDEEAYNRFREKTELIEKTVRETTSEYPAIYPYILEYVTEEKTTFRQMEQKGVPCGKNIFYDLRRKFYFLMASRI